MFRIDVPFNFLCLPPQLHKTYIRKKIGHEAKSTVRSFKCEGETIQILRYDSLEIVKLILKKKTV